MMIHEYGQDNERGLLFVATAALEPYWAFERQAASLGDQYHVYAVAADGHDGRPGDFTSVEQTARDMSRELRDRGVRCLFGAYGLSIGGAIVLRFLTTESIPVARAVIDGGILPYTYPRWVCKLILARDFVFARSLTRSRRLLELAAPPDRCTAEGHDPKREYDALMEFYRTYSSATIRNVFWSANNYELPHPAPRLETQVEYWYGERERRDRRGDMAYLRTYLPGVFFRQVDGVGHGELVMVHLSQFDRAIRAALDRPWD